MSLLSTSRLHDREHTSTKSCCCFFLLFTQGYGSVFALGNISAHVHINMMCLKDSREKKKRTNSGLGNGSRGCVQHVPVPAAIGPAPAAWSQPDTNPVDCSSVPGKNRGYTAWKLEVCSSSANNGLTTRFTVLLWSL